MCEGLEEVKLTETQQESLKKAMEYIASKDYAFELNYGYSELESSVLARLSGWMHVDDVPFTAVYKVAQKFCRKLYDEYRAKIKSIKENANVR